MILPDISFPADVLGLVGPEQTEIQLDVVFQLPDPQVNYRLPVRLLRRVVAASRVELWGTALDGTFDVHLRGGQDNRWQMQSRVADTELDGTQMLRILQMFDAVAHATGVGLVRSAATPETWSEISTAGLVAPPEGLREVVESHAEIERRLRISVAAPVSYTAAEVRDTLETAALLRGETISQVWKERRWVVPEAEADELVAGAFAGGAPALMELEEDWYWSVGKRQTPVGTVTVTYGSVRIAKVTSPDKSGNKSLVLVPGSDDQVLFRLVQVHSERLEDPDQRWFWEPAWQDREAEVDQLVGAGRITIHDDASSFLAHLDTVADEGKGD